MDKSRTVYAGGHGYAVRIVLSLDLLSTEGRSRSKVELAAAFGREIGQINGFFAFGFKAVCSKRRNRSGG